MHMFHIQCWDAQSFITHFDYVFIINFIINSWACCWGQNNLEPLDVKANKPQEN